MDERMHTTPWFHASNIPNAPASNLVQMGIGGWYGSRPGMKVARDRQSTVITISDVEELGIEKAVEVALECAWKDADAVFLSFDIDSIDAGFVRLFCHWATSLSTSDAEVPVGSPSETKKMVSACNLNAASRPRSARVP